MLPTYNGGKFKLYQFISGAENFFSNVLVYFPINKRFKIPSEIVKTKENKTTLILKPKRQNGGD